MTLTAAALAALAAVLLIANESPKASVESGNPEPEREAEEQAAPAALVRALVEEPTPPEAEDPAVATTVSSRTKNLFDEFLQAARYYNDKLERSYSIPEDPSLSTEAVESIAALYLSALSSFMEAEEVYFDTLAEVSDVQLELNDRVYAIPEGESVMNFRAEVRAGKHPEISPNLGDHVSLYPLPEGPRIVITPKGVRPDLDQLRDYWVAEKSVFQERVLALIPRLRQR